MNELIDLVLPINLTLDDLNIEKEKRKPMPAELKVAVGYVHHKDGNWENNDLNNLILLCKDCHSKIHAQSNKKVASVRSRKEAGEQAREKARVKREKLQTDRWRKNYYTQRKKR